MTSTMQPATATGTAEAVEQTIEEQRRRFRDVVGRFATGVTVVTWSNDGDMRGMTANAVSSLSLDPLLILVCVARGTTAHGHLASAGHLAVNILAEDQQDVSKAFSQRGLVGLPDVPVRAGVTGAPLVEGALAFLECRIAERLDGGDHTIYIGEVVDLSIERADAPPLLFFGGRYARVANE